MPFPATLNAADLDGTNGFRVFSLNGEAVGRSIAAAGDLNGDGIEDFVVSAPSLYGSSNGGAYVVFGTRAGFPANLDLYNLTGANGFRIIGPAGSYTAGGDSAEAVAGAGDVNGDGIDDLIVGGFGGYGGDGAAWIVFGKNTAVDGGFANDIELSSLTAATGFQLNGSGAERAGVSVSAAGDINGDGIGDFLIGADQADGPGRASVGRVYIVFGTDDPINTPVDLSTLDGTNGFSVEGATPGAFAGLHVAALGDVNGDGFDDFGFGAPGNDDVDNNAGAAYIVFGRNTAVSGAFAAAYDVDSFTGIRIIAQGEDDKLGAIASAGDFNNDGIDDIVVGAFGDQAAGVQAGAAYVIFGKVGGLTGDIDVTTLNGTNGFKISGVTGDYAGWVVKGGGDVNGDGFDDLVISAYIGGNPINDYIGKTYVLFGHGGSQSANVSLGGLTAQTGIVINGAAAYDRFGFSVSMADVNGDGLADILAGSGYAGAGYVIFGQRAGFVGNNSDQTFTGTAGVDVLDGQGGKDVLYGLGGDDVIDGGADNDILYGGDGADDLVGGTGSDILNGDDGDDELNGGDGADKLFGGLGSDLLTGGAGNDRMDGGDGIDTLNGGDGNDYLDGGIGADILRGGLLNDVYIVDNVGDQTIENSGEGYDIVRTALDGWVLAANIEGLELQGSADIDGTGNGEANNLQGNSGANTLSGLAGVDTINGNDGDDIIIGGLGNDLLRGGLGGDTFRVAHTFVGALETDQIYDFNAAEGDIMDFADAYSGTLSIVGAFNKQAGQMTLTFAGGITTVRLDINGDGKPEYQVKINGDVTGETGDWLL